METIVDEFAAVLKRDLDPLFEVQIREEADERAARMNALRHGADADSLAARSGHSELPSLACLFLGLCGGIVLTSMTTARRIL